MTSGDRFELRSTDDGTVIVTGVLDAVNAEKLSARLNEEDCPLFLDLGGVTFMDGAVVHILLAHRDRCTAEGNEFRIIAASEAVRRVVDLSGLTAIFGADIS